MTMPTADELRALKQDGWSDRRIAERYSVQQTTVTQWRKRLGVEAPNPAKPAQKMSVADAVARREALLPQAQKMLAQGLPRKKIAAVLSVAESTLRNWLRGKSTQSSSNLDTYAQMVYDAICAYKYQHNGNSPTRAQLAQMLNIAESTVFNAFQLLIQQKRIKRTGTRNTAGGIEIIGAQWIPPTGWKMPARLRTQAIKAPKIHTVKRKAMVSLAKAGRVCDCGREAHWVALVVIGDIKDGRTRGRQIRMPLCHVCADLEREIGTELMPINEHDEREKQP